MLRTYIYPVAFAPALLLAISSFCLYATTLVAGFSIAMLPLLLAGVATLCYTLYIFPIISFDNREITIIRLFPGRIIHLPWKEVQQISPLKSGSFLTTAGYVCNIRTNRKIYSVFPLSLGFYKLLKYWDAVKPKEERPPLLLDKIPVKNYREPLLKNFGFYLLLVTLMLFAWAFSTSSNQLLPVVSLLILPGMFIVIALFITGPYFNYFEFTTTHFYIRSPFFFWKYETRWEDIRAIQLVSTSKSKLIIICNKDYRYKFIPIGNLPSYEVISQLLKANIPIGMS